jgi:hypothetical protein
MDSMFERLFMSALAFRLKDGDLPMRCELFYANLLLPSRPPDVTLDLKKSAFKKQQKLFAAFEKKKLVAVKKVHGHECVARVDRDHPLYLEFVRAARDAGAGTSASAEPGDAGATDLGDDERGRARRNDARRKKKRLRLRRLRRRDECVSRVHGVPPSVRRARRREQGPAVRRARVRGGSPRVLRAPRSVRGRRRRDLRGGCGGRR